MSQNNAVEPLEHLAALFVPATFFRHADGPEMRLGGDVYRRTQLDDGPRYLPVASGVPQRG
jgi:hypothetical protein